MLEIDNVTILITVVLLCSVGAGMLGALVGLGGGVLIVPLLTIGLGVDIRLAVGSSIIAVIATSSGAGAALTRDGLTNVRVATFLQVATTLGAVLGASIAGWISTRVLYFLFGIVLLITVAPMVRKISDTTVTVVNDAWANRLQLNGQYPDQKGNWVSYQVKGTWTGFGAMTLAGIISGLLGIGSGALKVLAMDTAMGLPIKVSTATSNFMIGVTAAASAGIYFWRGDVLPVIAAPVALGVLIGSIVGARLLVRFRNQTIRTIFVVALTIVAVQMLLKGFGVG
jgi:uncharacterized protein